jgi:hypothetical protein
MIELTSLLYITIIFLAERVTYVLKALMLKTIFLNFIMEFIKKISKQF